MRLVKLMAAIPAIMLLSLFFSVSLATAASEFPISTAAADELNWNTATDGTNFLVVWTYPLRSSPGNVRTRLVGPDGQLLGDELSFGASAPQLFAYAAYDGKNYLIAWFEGDKLYGQFITPSGSKLDETFLIDSTLAKDSGVENLNWLAAGNSTLMLTWFIDNGTLVGELISDSSETERGRSISGIQLGESPQARWGHHTSIVSDGSRYFVVWLYDIYNADTGIHTYSIRGRFVSDSGEVGQQVTISQAPWTTDTDGDWPAAVASDGEGYLVIWSKQVGRGYYDADLYGRLISKEGVTQGDEFLIGDAPGADAVGKTIFDGEKYLVTWLEGFTSSSQVIKARYISKDGSMGDTFTLLEKNDKGLPAYYAIVISEGKYFASITRADSISDLQEAGPTPINSDIYGTFLDLEVPKPNIDSDSDGLLDKNETTLGTDPSKPDTDNDLLKDGLEVLTYHTNPLNNDTDNDGLLDGAEILTYKTDPLKNDTDGDGLLDGAEVNTYKSDPLKFDTDGDELSDGQEVTIFKTDPTKADTDGDGLSDGAEVNTYHTNPLKIDTDGDCAPDGVEISQKTNPLDPSDNKCPCKAIGAACTFGTDCCTGACSDGKCIAAIVTPTANVSEQPEQLEQSKGDSTILFASIIASILIIVGGVAYLLLIKKKPSKLPTQPPKPTQPPAKPPAPPTPPKPSEQPSVKPVAPAPQPPKPPTPAQVQPVKAAPPVQPQQKPAEKAPPAKPVQPVKPAEPPKTFEIKLPSFTLPSIRILTAQPKPQEKPAVKPPAKLAEAAKPNEVEKPKKSEADKQILDWIRQSRTRGYSFNDLRTHLVKSGFPKDEVDRAIRMEEEKEGPAPKPIPFAAKSAVPPQATSKPRAPEVDAQMLDWIKQSRARGYEFSEIRDYLIQNRYPKDEVDRAIRSEEGKEGPAPTQIAKPAVPSAKPTKSLLNEKIRELIKTSRALGYEYPEIREHLVRDGYPEDEVDMVILFEEAKEKKGKK
jgi:DNA-binding transcriptional MerR regulator